MVRGVLEKNQDAMFRTSLVKSTLQIDSNPDYDKVESYFKHLIAECEALSVVGTRTVTTTTATPKAEPRLRPLKPEPKHTPAPPNSSTTTRNTTSLPSSNPSAEEGQKPGTPKGEVPCRFFGKTVKGCIRGNKCPFLHSWEGLDKKERCLHCGGQGHVAKECPVKKTPPSSNGNTPKNDKNNQGGTSSTATRTVRIDDKPEVSPIPASSGETTSAQADLKDVLRKR